MVECGNVKTNAVSYFKKAAIKKSSIVSSALHILAWAFLHTMAFVLQNNLIHCDLSDSNVLFYVDGDKIFVSVSNRGLASNITYPLDLAYEEDDEHAVR